MSGGPTVGELRYEARRLLSASGMPESNASRTAEILVLADVWGLASHGLMRLPHYLERIAAGGCRADAALTPVSDTGGVVVYDGGAGLGHWQVWRAVERAAELSTSNGIAAVGVRNSSHCGALGTYVYPALDAGLLTLVFSNGPPAMPPWQGTRPVLSTSPLAAGVPAAPHPVVIDLATSAVARGTIAWRAQHDLALEPGWAFDADGAPTADARAALQGMLAPMGGSKGFVVALLIEALTGGLVGPNLSAAVPDMFNRDDDAKPQGIGHLVVTVRPDAFDSAAVERFTALAEHVGDAGGRTPGASRLAPADVADDHTVDVAGSTVAQLGEWAKRLGTSPARV